MTPPAPSRSASVPSAAPSSAPSPSSSPGEAGWGWTPVHRCALALLLTFLLGFLILQAIRRPIRLDAPQWQEGSIPALEQALDPNTADWPSLARIPQLGEKLARSIVSYRELHRDAQGVAFQNLADLDRVSGIGPKTLQAIRPYLSFPGDATQPASPLIPSSPVAPLEEAVSEPD